MHTQDTTLKLLSTAHLESGETVLALMSETDPKRQRKVVKKQDIVVEKEKSPVKEESSEEEEDDDGDIFAQFSAPKKIKKEEVKKVVAVEEAKEPEPIKHSIQIKLIQFDEEANQKKECRELWKIEVPKEFPNKLVKTISNSNRFAFLVKDIIQGEEQLILFIYDLKATKYLGYINLS